MAHAQQVIFCHGVQRMIPHHFVNCSVLDIGSLDINGCNRELFKDCDYTGVDLAPGKNVDVACRGHEYDRVKPFDTVISTEALEHDMFYPKTLANMVRLVRPGGLLIFTCATTGRQEHGTKNRQPKDSPFTSGIEGWQDYYKNLTADDIKEALDVDAIFYHYAFEVDARTRDLRFWGMKG